MAYKSLVKERENLREFNKKVPRSAATSFVEGLVLAAVIMVIIISAIAFS